MFFKKKKEVPAIIAIAEDKLAMAKSRGERSFILDIREEDIHIVRRWAAKKSIIMDAHMVVNHRIVYKLYGFV